MSEVQQLYRLQEIDIEIREKKHRLGEVLRAQKETDELLAARQQVTSIDAELRTWQVQHKDLSLELDSLNSKAKRSENRLYSGKVTNPKELTDLQNELDSLGRRRGGLEDTVLEAMIMIEDKEAEKAAAEEALSAVEASWEQSQANLRQQQNELALRLRELAGMREEQLPLITAASLAEYESISKRSRGVAVAILKGNICLGCQLNVTTNIHKGVNEGKRVHCNNCGRLLTLRW